MKTIFLIRHAEAHSAKKGLTDYDRPLVPKGEKTVKKMAKQLRKELVAPDLIISSPAERALATAHIFADVLRFPIKNIMLKPAIYDSTNSELFLGIMQGIENKHHSILLIGHEPTLSQFASVLVKDFCTSIPKGGVVGITFDKTNWREIVPAEGTIKLFDFPTNKLKKHDIEKKFANDLQANLHDQLTSKLARIDHQVTKKIKAKIKKASAELAKDFVRVAKNYGDKSFLNKLTQNYCNKRIITETASQPILKEKADLVPKEPPKKVAILKSNIRGKMQKTRSAAQNRKRPQNGEPTTAKPKKMPASAPKD